MSYKELTEQEVQEFCNMFGVFVAVDENGKAYWFSDTPTIKNGYSYWAIDRSETRNGLLPFRILSTLPWTEQIWRPENQQPRSDEQ